LFQPWIISQIRANKPKRTGCLSAGSMVAIRSRRAGSMRAEDRQLHATAPRWPRAPAPRGRRPWCSGNPGGPRRPRLPAMALRQPCIHATAALGDPALAQTGGGKSARWPVPGPWLPVGAGRSYVFAAPSFSLLSAGFPRLRARSGSVCWRLAGGKVLELVQEAYQTTPNSFTVPISNPDERRHGPRRRRHSRRRSCEPYCCGRGWCGRTPRLSSSFRTNFCFCLVARCKFL